MLTEFSNLDIVVVKAIDPCGLYSKRVDAMGITEVLIAPHSPWQNPYAERVIGSIRRECLDYVVVFNERHLRRVLSALTITSELERTFH